MMYKKNIFDIDYDKLKKNGIKCLVFDLDNTLGLIDEEKCPKEAKKLLKKLKKDFTIFISYNTFFIYMIYIIIRTRSFTKTNKIIYI